MQLFNDFGHLPTKYVGRIKPICQMDKDIYVEVMPMHTLGFILHLHYVTFIEIHTRNY
jgi:hypothetical protein